MSLPNLVHATLVPSIMDGKRSFVASLEEMPGIVVLGDTERAALDELKTVVDNVQTRMGEATVEMVEPVVVAYQWCSYPANGRPAIVASHNYPPVCPEGLLIDSSQELLAF